MMILNLQHKCLTAGNTVIKFPVGKKLYTIYVLYNYFVNLRKLYSQILVMEFILTIL